MLRLTFDTSFLVGIKYHFNSYDIKRLITLIDAGEIEVFLVDVIDKEIQSKIKCSTWEMAIKAGNALTSNRLFELADFSECQGIQDILLKGFRVKLHEKAMSMYSDFKDNIKVTMITCDHVSPCSVFDKYFNSSPPFSRKKKSEFPDAFATQALIEHFDDQPFTVLSRDPDWQKVFANNSSVTVCEKLSQVISSLPAATTDSVINEWLGNIIGDCWPEIMEGLDAELKDRRFTVYNATNVKFDWIETEYELEEVSVDFCTKEKARVVVSVRFDFHTMVSYDIVGISKDNYEHFSDDRTADVYVLLDLSKDPKKGDCKFLLDLDLPSVIQLDPYDPCYDWCGYE